MRKSFWDRIRYTYWGLVPYDWRPKQIYYRFKCWIWKRYTTIKPRYLNFHTWCDRCELLPHAMFEILSKFIEEECSPGHIDWEGSGHTVEVNGKQVNIREEMQCLYDWWHNTYNKEYEEVHDILWKEAHKHDPIREEKEIEIHGETYYEWKPEFKNKEDEEIWRCCVRACSKLEEIQNRDLEEKMTRLVKCRPYMWT